MAGTYKVVELVGTSPTSFAEATKAAIAEASKTLRHMDWFEVVQDRGRIVEGKGGGIPGRPESRVQD
jgi:flavin-binding protein dodecin